MEDDPGPIAHIPVDLRSIVAVVERTRALEHRTQAVRDAVAQLSELAADYRRDAVRRLQERGASEAQVARYEDALEAALEGVRAPLCALEEACEEAQRAAEALR